MPWVQDTLNKATTHLRDMTASQRLAILMGLLLVTGSVAWLAQWAARPEMTPLLDQPMDPAELAAAHAALQAMGENARIEGNQLWVSSSANRPALLAQLQQQNKLPSDTSAGFRALVRESNPWISSEENERRWTVALQNEIAFVLEQFSGVKTARVFLNLAGRPRGFSRVAPPASASVTLIMRGGEPVPRELALATARLVSGAVRGLPLRSVEVVDGQGRVALNWDQESDSGTLLHELRRKAELEIADKIRSQLNFDSRLRVNVQVDMELSTLDVVSTTPTEPVDVSQETTTDQTTRVRRGSQPGVEPNVGLVAAGAAADEQTTSETTRVERVPGSSQQTKRTPAGEIREVFAAINVSHAFLVNVFKRNNPGATEPTEEQIQAVFESEREKIINQVTALVKPQEPDQVRVDWYYDSLDVAAEAGAGSAGDTLMDLAGRFGAPAGLGLLAMLSLGLMFRMARGSNVAESFGLELGLPKDAIEAAKTAAAHVSEVARRPPIVSRPTARAGESGEQLPSAVPAPVAQADEIDGFLEAREVDEATVQINKMVTQVAEMVEKDADAVGGLFARWIEQQRKK